MKLNEVIPWLYHRTRNGEGEDRPWLHWAIYAYERGWYKLIGGRTEDSELYLARFWMHRPNKRDGRWDSARSDLLHYFAQGDDDGALHDHPWDFKTRVLSGGYREIRPESFLYCKPREFRPRLGPTKLMEHDVQAGDTVYRKYYDLHAVADPLSDTWTMVNTTRMHADEWGFHPASQEWVPWREYLADKTTAG